MFVSSYDSVMVRRYVTATLVFEKKYEDAQLSTTITHLMSIYNRAIFINFLKGFEAVEYF